MEFIIPIIFIPIFILLWVGVTGLISIIGGWRGLAKVNPVPAAIPETGETYSLQSVRLGFFGNYNSSVTITVYTKGVRIAPIFIFSLFHRPFYIAYGAMAGVSYGRFIVPYLTFSLGGSKIMIRGKCVLKIKERIGPAVR